MLALAGVEPRGFVAPAYAYTPALRHELAAGFDWWATMLRFVGRERAALAPAVALRRSPLAVRAAALAAGRLLRLDLHPADFDRPRTCSRSSPSCAAPAPHRRHLRRPLLIRPRGRRG